MIIAIARTQKRENLQTLVSPTADKTKRACRQSIAETGRWGRLPLLLTDLVPAGEDWLLYTNRLVNSNLILATGAKSFERRQARVENLLKTGVVLTSIYTHDKCSFVGLFPAYLACLLPAKPLRSINLSTLLLSARHDHRLTSRRLCRLLHDDPARNVVKIS